MCRSYLGKQDDQEGSRWGLGDTEALPVSELRPRGDRTARL